MSDFSVEYDDQPNEVVDKISDVLKKKHGLSIEWDGKNPDVMGYYIIKRKDL
jgi:hypothetical protein